MGNRITNEPPLVVYIIGDSRSGSTLLDSLLSQHSKAVSVGELHHLREYYFKTGMGERTDWKCACGAYLKECSFWAPILKELPMSKDFVTKLPAIRESIWSFFSRRRLKKEINNSLSYRENDQAGKQLARTRWMVYNAINQKTGRRIIVDSSKNPYEAFYLDKYKEGEILFLLMERDIWEVAYSKMCRARESIVDGAKVKSIYTYLLSSNRNQKKNEIISSKIEKSLLKRIHYLDLVNKTKEEMEEVYCFLNIPFALPLEENDFNGHPLHGSPSRKKRNKIQADIRWKSYYRKNRLAYLFAKLVSKTL